MCGIHGVINIATATKSYLEKYIEEGFIVNSVRGMDSAGILQVDKKNQPYMNKLTMPGPMFIDQKATKNIIADASKTPLTICHVRAATQGKVTVDNAHPFMVKGADNGRIIGVHNGTLNNSWKGKEDAGKFDVDSAWALTHIGKYGIKAFEDIEGAFVFAWWDENHPGKFFAVRNTGRPLWFTMTKDKTQMLFGSESGMVSWLCERNNVETLEDIYELDPMKLYTFDYTGKEITFTKESVPAYVTKYVPAAPNSTSLHPYQRDDWSNRRQRRRNAEEAFRGVDGDNQQFDWDDNLGFTRNDEGRGGADRAANSFPPAAQHVLDASKRVLGEARSAIFKAQTDASRGVVDTEIVAQRDDDSPSIKERSQSNKAKRRAKKAAKVQNREQRKEQQRERLSLKPRAATLAEGLAAAAEAVQRREVDDFNAAIRAGNQRAAVDGTASFPEEILPDKWFSKGGVMEAERNAAKSEGMYGQMQWFIGRCYEPETGELIGDVEDYIPGEGKKNYVAIMRNTTASVAEREYMHSGAWVAVTGVSFMREWNGKVLIVGELTNEGKTGMMRRQAA